MFDRAAQLAAALEIARRDADRGHTEAARLGRELAELRAVRDAIASNAQRLAQENAELRDAAAADRTVGGLIKDRLVVFLGDGGAFDGLLLANDGRTLTFADVHRRGQDTVTAAAPGELYIDRARVLYMQRLAADQSRGE